MKWKLALKIQLLRSPLMAAAICLFAALSFQLISSDGCDVFDFVVETEESKERVEQGSSTTPEIDRTVKIWMVNDFVYPAALICSPHLTKVLNSADSILRKSHRQRGPPVSVG